MKLKTSAHVEALRGSDGKLPTHCWPGFYPLFYVTSRNEILCSACANGDEHDEFDAQFPIVASDANWEDPELYCDACQERIESAYAEDEESSEDE